MTLWFLPSSSPSHRQATDLTQIRKVAISGSNLGSAAQLSSTGIAYRLQSQAKAQSQFTPLPGSWAAVPTLQIVSWTDTAIVFFSLQASAFLQVNYTTAAYGTGLRSVTTSNVAFYSDVSPAIAAITYTQPPRTRGGDVIVLTSAYMTGVNYTAYVSVGGANCPIIDPTTGLVVPPNRVSEMLQRVYPGDRTLYDISCTTPPGEGTNVSVVLTRDNSTSAPFPNSYAPPTITSVTVTASGGSSVTYPPTAVLVVPTASGTITLTGTNFGLYPTVNITLAGVGSCVVFSSQTPGGAGCVLATGGASYSSLSFPVPPGVGQGWVIMLTVGGQTFQPGTRMDFARPTVSSVQLVNGRASTQVVL